MSGKLFKVFLEVEGDGQTLASVLLAPCSLGLIQVPGQPKPGLFHFEGNGATCAFTFVILKLEPDNMKTKCLKAGKTNLTSG